VVRVLLATVFCLGNDEAYYYTYALYPDLSHFDHPSMIGWVIQLFSFNLHFDSELFIRMAAVIGGTMNTWLMYCIGRQLSDELTGWYAALLYTASIYGFVIVGVFILPDSPQSVFWLLSILFLMKAFKGEIDKRAKLNFLLASLFMGLAFMSKYTTAYLWLGMSLFILSSRRLWLKTSTFYLAQLLLALSLLPTLLWNAQNGFVSFLFHSGRIGPSSSALTLDHFLTEILGEALYTNPINLVLIAIAVIAFFRLKGLTFGTEGKLLLMIGLPLVLTFLIASIFQSTLPHWNGAGYLTLLPLAAVWLRSRSESRIPKAILASMGFILLTISVCTAQILTGFLPLGSFGTNKGGQGSSDYSLEVYGWHQLHDEFGALAEKYENKGLMPQGSPIVSYRWFPAGNYSYYAARGTNRGVMAAGDTSEIHQFAWTNALQGGFKLNSAAWYITSSRDFKPPSEMKALYYGKVSLPDTIAIKRMGKQVYSFFVYRLQDLQWRKYP